jgi:hypothetical protein
MSDPAGREAATACKRQPSGTAQQHSTAQGGRTRSSVELAAEEEALHALSLQRGVALVGWQVVVLNCRAGQGGRQAAQLEGAGSLELMSQLAARGSRWHMG